MIALVKYQADAKKNKLNFEPQKRQSENVGENCSLTAKFETKMIFTRSTKGKSKYVQKFEATVNYLTGEGPFGRPGLC